MEKGKVVSLEDRIPKLKQQRRKKANRRLIFLLFVFFALIVFVVYFQSPLSHVNKIDIEGNQVYSDETLISLSGLTNETSIWGIDKEAIKGKFEELEELKVAEVEVKFPNHVVIHIQEWERIAFMMKEGAFLPVLENGEILKAEPGAIFANAPVLIGFSEGEALQEMINGLEAIPEEVANSISEIHYSPKETDPFHVSLFMNDGFEVSASIRTFAEKMVHYPSIVSQLDPEIKGVIDLEVGSYFRAYELEGAEVENEEETEG